MEIKVFGMDKCPGCDTVKAVLKQRGVEFALFDVMNVDHMEEAQQNLVRSVPTVIVKDGGVEHVFVGSAKPTIDSLVKHLGA